MKTTEKGDLGRGLILADLLKRGFKVSIPLHEDCLYDLVLDRGGPLERVQCKSTNSGGKRMRVKCSSTSTWGGTTKNEHKYTKDDIEWLAVCDLHDGQIYYIPAELLGDGRSEMNLRITPAKNKQARGIRWARDYQTL